MMPPGQSPVYATEEQAQLSKRFTQPHPFHVDYKQLTGEHSVVQFSVLEQLSSSQELYGYASLQYSAL